MTSEFFSPEMIVSFSLLATDVTAYDTGAFAV